MVTIHSPLRYLWRLLGGVLLVSFACLVLMIQPKATVISPPVLDPLAINTIEQLIVDNAPATINEPGELTLHLDAEELNLLAAFLIQNVPDLHGVSANVSLLQDRAEVDVSLPVASYLLPLYLNLHAGVREARQGLDLYAVKIGHLPVPDALVHHLLGQLESDLSRAYVNYRELSALRDSLKTVAFAEDQVQITLDWNPQLLARVQTQAEQLLMSPDDKARIVAYFGRLVDIVNALPEDTRSISLNLVMFPLFDFARERVVAGSDPVAENRSLLQALSLYVNESDLSQLIEPPGAAALITPRRVSVTIQRRPDLAQHFTSSAAMTASVGAGVAGLLSTSKEAHDARYRTGFSFSDLTANSAGVALGKAATSSGQAARDLQARLAAAGLETDYMPPVSRDNAGLTEDDFSAQYTDRNSDAYARRISAIETEISALPIYHLP